MTLPANYRRINDSISVTLDDGRDINTYLIRTKTNEWLIDEITPIIEVYCSWTLLVVVTISVICGMPTFFVWGGIFGLQIISHLPLLSIDLPLNELKFLAFVNRVVSFDYFNPKPLQEISFSRSEPFNQNFARMGY